MKCFAKFNAINPLVIESINKHLNDNDFTLAQKFGVLFATNICYKFDMDFWEYEHFD